MLFKELNLENKLQNGLANINFSKLTPIQEQCLPQGLKGNSQIIVSSTGSGKTHTYLIPLLNNIILDRTYQGIIILPTRELARQIYNVTLELIKQSEIEAKVLLAIGGNDREQEIKKINNQDGFYNIVIATLGRMNDLVISENVLKIHNAKTIIIDEADMIFEADELEEVDKILGKIQDNPQFLIASATINKGLEHFLKKYLTNIKTIKIEEESLTKTAITHSMVLCKAKDKNEMLIKLLNIINPFMAIIFCNTTTQVDEVSDYLAKNNIKVAKIHGSLDDRNRKQIIKRINNLQYKYIVASDIASRGIDIQGVSHVINYDLPKDIEFYIHRSGRTARFDQEGICYTLYGYNDDEYVKKLKNKGLKVIYQKIENDSLVEATFTKRKAAKAKTYEDSLHEKIPLSKKVKPGYKKKRKEQIKKLVQRAKHAHIDEIYSKHSGKKNG